MAARTLLQLLVVERGMTFSVFQRAYERAANELASETDDRALATASVSEQTFRRWTAGRLHGLPAQPAPQVLEHMFGVPARLLMAPPTDMPPTPTRHERPLLDESELVMTARDAAAHAGDAASQSLPDITLDQLGDDVVALARAYSQTSPIEVYSRAKDLLTVAQGMLERTQVPRQRNRLYLAAGQSAALLSAVSFDLGALAPAVQLSRTAALYGQVIEYGPLQAYAHGVLAFVAYWDGRPAEAVRLVHTAQRFGGLGDTARTRLAVIEGRAYGHLGRREEAEHAVRNALEPGNGHRDELHDDVGGEFGFPDARVAMSNATTYLLLRDAEGAEAAADRALGLLDDAPAAQRSLLTAAQASVDLARARLLRHELDGAAAALEPVFDISGEWRIAGLTERLAAVRADLTQPHFRGAPAVESLGERIEDFCAVAATRQLGGTGRLALEG